MQEYANAGNRVYNGTKLGLDMRADNRSSVRIGTTTVYPAVCRRRMRRNKRVLRRKIAQ